MEAAGGCTGGDVVEAANGCNGRDVVLAAAGAGKGDVAVDVARVALEWGSRSADPRGADWAWVSIPGDHKLDMLS